MYSIITGYITLTSHYLEDWVLKNKVLATRKLEVWHSSCNLASILHELVEKFAICDTVAVTTDNASNMVTAIREFGVPHIQCFTHSLQLAVQEGLQIEEMDEVVTECRALVGNFNHSEVSKQTLDQVQRRAGVKKPLKLLQDCPSRSVVSLPSNNAVVSLIVLNVKL